MRKSDWNGVARVGLACIGIACLGLGTACGEEEGAASDATLGAPPARGESTANRPPQIERLRFEPAEPLPEDTLRAVATVRDPDGDRVTQSFLWRVAGRELAESGPEIQLRGVAKGVEIEVEVSAIDGRATSASRSASTEVANRRPVLENVALQPIGTVLPGDPALALPIAEDPDGDALDFRFRWSVNDAVLEGEEEASLSTHGLRSDDRIRVQVVANDGESESDAVWSAVLLVGNAAPEIVSAPSGVAPGEAFTYVVKARDPEGDRSLRYELRKGPDGMTMNPVLGELRWLPQAGQAGAHPVEIAVLDSRGGTTVQTFELTVGAGAPPPPAAAAE
jgi:hypothetical protein